jgi:thermostable 8-oxoguanine DNA glycosylase
VKAFVFVLTVLRYFKLSSFGTHAITTTNLEVLKAFNFSFSNKRDEFITYTRIYRLHIVCSLKKVHSKKHLQSSFTDLLNRKNAIGLSTTSHFFLAKF